MALPTKHVVITGAAAGIGRATALHALAQGARVTALDIVDPKIDELAYVYCDVSKPESWEAAAADTGRPDCLFLNAGVMSAPPQATADGYAFLNVTSESYRRLTGVNVDGVVFGLQAFVPAMAAGSSIVITASLAGIYPYPHDALYAMTKHAVVGLTRSLAPTLAERGIRLNALCPNRVDTQLLPTQMRSLDFLSAEGVAADVLGLFEIQSTGGLWAKTFEDQPLYLIGDRKGSSWRARLGRLSRRVSFRRR